MFLVALCSYNSHCTEAENTSWLQQYIVVLGTRVDPGRPVLVQSFKRNIIREKAASSINPYALFVGGVPIDPWIAEGDYISDIK